MARKKLTRRHEPAVAGAPAGDVPLQGEPIRGIHAAAIVLVGVAILNAGNYLFHILCARRLGPARYGDLATLITISSLIALPLGGAQVWVARHVAIYRGSHDYEALHWFTRRVLVYLTGCATVVTLLLISLTWPLQHIFGIASTAAVGITALTAFPAIVSPVTWGLAQGLERFGLVATVYAVGPISRIGLTLVAFDAGLHVGGAMIATLVSMLVAFGLPLVVLRQWVKPAPAKSRRLSRSEAGRSLIPAMVGLLAITGLTSNDVLVAKLFLSDHATGIYGTASLVGRVVFYLSAAVVTVLLPRVAARTASNRDTTDLLGQSLFVTASIAIAATIFYAALGGYVIDLAFGNKYKSAVGLLWLFGVAMSEFAILNILLIYHLGRGEVGIAWFLAGGAALQLVFFGFAHASGHTLVLVDIATATILIVAHELVFKWTLTRSVASAARAWRLRAA